HRGRWLLRHRQRGHGGVRHRTERGQAIPHLDRRRTGAKRARDPRRLRVLLASGAETTIGRRAKLVRRRVARVWLAGGLSVALLAGAGGALGGRSASGPGERIGTPWTGRSAVHRTTAEIMAAPRAASEQLRIAPRSRLNLVPRQTSASTPRPA